MWKIITGQHAQTLSMCKCRACVLQKSEPLRLLSQNLELYKGYRLFYWPFKQSSDPKEDRWRSSTAFALTPVDEVGSLQHHQQLHWAPAQNEYSTWCQSTCIICASGSGRQDCVRCSGHGLPADGTSDFVFLDETKIDDDPHRDRRSIDFKVLVNGKATGELEVRHPWKHSPMVYPCATFCEPDDATGPARALNTMSCAQAKRILAAVW